MNWFSGSIAEAVALSKAKNAIFVVYVEGKDELSEKLRRFINDDKIKQKMESDCFVAVRVEGGSESYMQFAQIYQLVPLPSMFFIGKNGTPIEIATGVVNSVDELDSKIERVLSVAGLKIDAKQKPAASSAPSSLSALTTPSAPTAPSTPAVPAAIASVDLISSEQAASSSSDIVCEGGVCYRKTEKKDEPKEQSQPEPEIPKLIEVVSENKEQPKPETKEQKGEEADDAAEKVAQEIQEIQKLLEEKRKEKDAEEARLEREKEIRRRKEGQDVQTLKKWQHEHELQELKDSIRKDKLEEQAARQRILEKIASDKAERAQKFGQISPLKPEQAAPKVVPVQRPSQDNFDSSRIQFKKPDGDSEMHTFKSADTFQTVRSYVKGTLLQGTGIREFSLATAFPRKEFTVEDDNKTLSDLSLCPTAVLLVITRTNTGAAAVVARSGGVVNIFNSIFWGILSPFFAALNYIKGFFGGGRPPASTAAATGAQKRASENAVDHQELAKKRTLDRFSGNSIVNDFPSTSADPKTGVKPIPYRRIGGSNVHRLRDQRDSDDENNTWNGNSTQQQ